MSFGEALFDFCLGPEVMVFVNQVSEIVHGAPVKIYLWPCRQDWTSFKLRWRGICDTYHGSPNKIIGGNSFLVATKQKYLKKQHLKEDFSWDKPELRCGAYATRMTKSGKRLLTWQLCPLPLGLRHKLIEPTPKLWHVLLDRMLLPFHRCASQSKCKSPTLWQSTDFILGYSSAFQTSGWTVLQLQTLSVYMWQRERAGLNWTETGPSLQVTLGFGLHCGWAIEGAIGSEYKIDASYLLLGFKRHRSKGTLKDAPGPWHFWHSSVGASL